MQSQSTLEAHQGVLIGVCRSAPRLYTGSCAVSTGQVSSLGYIKASMGSAHVSNTWKRVLYNRDGLRHTQQRHNVMQTTKSAHCCSCTTRSHKDTGVMALVDSACISMQAGTGIPAVVLY